MPHLKWGTKSRIKMTPFRNLTMSDSRGSIPLFTSRRVQWAESSTFSMVQKGVP